MITASGTVRVINDLEEHKGLSRCSAVFKSGSDEQFIGLKFWHNSVNTNGLQYVKKGKELFVSGRLTIREYNGKVYVDINVNEFEFLGSPSKKPVSNDTKPEEVVVSDTPEKDIPF